MDKSELNQKYELVIILDAKLNPDEKETLSKDLSSLVTRYGGKVINSRLWIERQRLSFSIKKRQEGSYYLINFEGEGSLVKKIETDLRIHEGVLRFAIYEAQGLQQPVGV